MEMGSLWPCCWAGAYRREARAPAHLLPGDGGDDAGTVCAGTLAWFPVAAAPAVAARLVAATDRLARTAARGVRTQTASYVRTARAEAFEPRSGGAVQSIAYYYQNTNGLSSNINTS